MGAWQDGGTLKSKSTQPTSTNRGDPLSTSPFLQGKCSKCKKQIKSYNGITGLHCRWCHLTVRKTFFHTLTKTHRASSLTGANLTSYSRTASQPVRFPRLSRVHPWPKPRAYPATHGHLSDCLGQAEVGSCIIASSLSLSSGIFLYYPQHQHIHGQEFCCFCLS